MLTFCVEYYEWLTAAKVYISLCIIPLVERACHVRIITDNIMYLSVTDSYYSQYSQLIMFDKIMKMCGYMFRPIILTFSRNSNNIKFKITF
jgi:hypothetical protein